MADRVRPLKLEHPSSGGTQTDLDPTELNPNQDAPEVRAVYFQNDSSTDTDVEITRDASSPDKLTFKDEENTTPVSLTQLLAGSGGLTEGAHEGLDTLVHDLAEDGVTQVTRSSGRITNVTFWDGEDKVRECVVTRSGGKVSQIDIIQYDAGTENVRMTGVVTRDGGRVDDITWTKTVA
ncbi:MAG: hypothetical protein ACXAEU_17225 [Candidatus Hodarchaeales archaeon]|jgi:hypothetical protein